MAETRDGAQGFEKSHAVNDGHEQVEEDGVRRKGGEQIKGFAPVDGGADVKLMIRKIGGDEPAGIFVIIDHEQFFFRQEGALEHGEQVFTDEGFLQDLHRAEDAPAVFSGHDADDDDGDVAQEFVGLDGLEHIPAVHVRHQ